MKKFLAVVLAFVVAIGMVAAMGCTKTATGPTDAQKTATAVEVGVHATETAVASTLYSQDFETSVGGWALDTLTQAISNVALSTTKAYHGTQSVALTVQMVAGAQAAYVDKSIFNAPPTNWAGKTITMHVWIPAALLASATPYAFEITMQAGSGWATTNSWVTTGLVGDAWNTLTLVIPTNPDTAAGIDDIGFNIQEAGGTDMASPAVLYLDDITVN